MPVVAFEDHESDETHKAYLISAHGRHPQFMKNEWRNDSMVKHVILWNLKETLSDAEKEAVKKGAKEGLESLMGKIPGLVDIKVNTVGLPSSNADMMLDSTFESAEALKGYSTHPEHVAVADSKVRPFTASRVCMDYEV